MSFTDARFDMEGFRKLLALRAEIGGKGSGRDPESHPDFHTTGARWRRWETSFLPPAASSTPSAYAAASGSIR